MPREAKIALAILLASLAASALASFFNSRLAAIALGSPALLLSGWAFFGHFLTLDDDMLGGFSNPENSRSYYYKSLAEMVIKGAVLALVVWLVVYWPL